MREIENNLDCFQQRFCLEESTAIRLLAPAGCGKTHSILWRCYYQYQNCETPQNFLIVTFTTAAARELRRRLNSTEAFSQIRKNLRITTLNAWGNKYLKNKDRDIKLLSKNSDKHFAIHNLLKPTLEQYPKIKNAAKYQSSTIFEINDYLKSLGFRHDVHEDFDAFIEHIDWLKKHGLENHIDKIFDDLVGLHVIDKGNYETCLEQTHCNYFPFWCDATKKLHEHSIITFEDQKYWTFIDLSLKKAYPSQNRFTQIIVDEFQDINILDLNLLREIARIHQTELTIIGDDDQAIYEWRGASPSFIVNPEEFFNTRYKTFILETNYRSPRNILDHSQNIIRNNSFRVDKKINSKKDTNAEIKIVGVPSITGAISFVCNYVKNMSGNDTVAIVGRKRSQIIPYQVAFSREGIPFFAAEDLNVFLSKSFKDLQKVLEITSEADVHFRTDTAVQNLLFLCDKVKKYPLKKEERTKVFSHVKKGRPTSINEALETFSTYNGPLKTQNINLKTTQEFYIKLQSLFSAETVSEAIEVISKDFIGLQKDYNRGRDDVFFLDPPFAFLSEFAEDYGDDFVGFNEDIQNVIDTLPNIPADDDADLTEGEGAQVHLMTALRAKGREFDTVIILDANDGIWPIDRATKGNELEQERRLFYVAFTRARKRLFCLVNNAILGKEVIPSPYLYEGELL